MSKAERVKEFIGILKVLLGIFSAILISLIGFIATSWNKVNFIILFLSFIGILIVGVSLVVVVKKIFENLDELEKL